MQEHVVGSMPEFVAVVERWPRTSTYYRGVRDKEFELISSLGRYKTPLRQLGRSPRDLVEIERGALRAFQLESSAYLDRVPANEWEWLALAQHHGMPTRLLDWTRSPLTALFFALESVVRAEQKAEGAEKKPETDAAVYGWHPADGEVRFLSGENAGTVSPFEIHQIHAFVPARVNRRVGAQGSLFTAMPDPWEAMDDSCIERIVIPRAAKRVLLDFLLRAGVSASALFPDLDGVSRHLRMQMFDFPIWEASLSEPTGDADASD